MEPPTIDDLVVQRARRGDSVALEQLLEVLAPQIWKIARRMMGNDADAADASQEALIAVARGLPGFDGRAAISSWAHRVATNACLDEIRRRDRRPTPTDSDLNHSVPSYQDPSVVDRLDIDRTLATLPGDFRAALVLREVFGHDYDAIASILDCPIGTVRSRLSRARALLANELGFVEDAEAGNFSGAVSVSSPTPPAEKDSRP